MLFYSFSSIALVTDPNGFVEALEEKHLSVVYDQCQDCSERQDIQLCVQKLCGAPNPANSAIITGQSLEQMKDSTIEMQFQKDKALIKDSFEKSAYFSEELLKELEKRNLSSQMNSKERSAYIMNAVLPHLDIVQTANGSLTITYDEMDKLSTSQKNFMNGFIGKIKSKSVDNFQLKYDLGLSLSSDDLKREIDRIEELVSLKNPKTEQLNSLLQGLKWIDSQTNQYNPTPKFIYNIASFLSNVRAQILPILNISSYPDMCQGLSCIAFINSKLIPEKRKKLKSYSEMVSKLDDAKLERMTNKCLGAYYFDDTQTKFINNSNFKYQGKDRVLKYIRNTYSEETFKMVSDYFSMSMDIKTDNKDVFNQDDVDKIKRIATDDRQVKIESINKMSSMSDFELLNNLDNQFYYDRPMLSQLQMFCSSDMSETLPVINDHYQPVFDKVQLSHFTCSHPNIGQDIFAHELGHVFSELLSRGNSSEESSKKFLERRQCVSSLYRLPDYKGSFAKKHPFDHFRTEEDMADFFSAQVHNYNKDNKRVVSMCALLPVSNGAYGNIQVENRSYDNHSSAFIRILREAYFKGMELGENCQRIMNKNRHLFEFKRCE